MSPLCTMVRTLWLGSLTAIAAGAVACSTTPPEDPVRTLERADRVATLCLQVNRQLDDGLAYKPLPEPIPAPQDACNGVNPNLERGQGEFYPFHYYALATGTLRGELAVIDMTLYKAADTDKSSPGVNFIPVGENPVDVATTPDSRWAFVASAASQKPGIYAVPSILLLGDSRTDENGKTIGFVPKLTDLVGCALPSAPSGLAVVPNGSTGTASPYDLVAVLAGDRLTPARLLAIDVASFRDPSTNEGPLAAGSFDACPIKYEIAGTLPPAPPASPDLEWSDGTDYIEGNALDSDIYPLPTSCGGGDTDADAGAPPADGGGAGTTDAGAGAGGSMPPMPVRFGRSTQDGSMLYVADLDNPVIHVFDLGATPPVELAPLEVVSSADPTGTLSVRDIAVSPPTREFRRFLYAVEAAQGSLLVFDVTDKNTPYRKPLVRPHSELQPFQPVDRLQFASAINAVTFARHDVPLAPNLASGVAASGVLCNPNSESDPGQYYRENRSVVTPALGPKRLRGIFAFVALANGQIVVLDVDDWDAPCRRPANLSQPPTAPRASSISEPQIASAESAYGAPLLSTPEQAARVSREAYFPVSAPHRMRSSFMLRNENDTEGGDRVPKAPGGITLSQGNTPLDTVGAGAEQNPLLQPTAGALADPGAATSTATTADGGAARVPAVRFSYEVPDVHVDQDWAISYEGALPGFPGVRGRLSTSNGFQTLTMASPETDFCALGIEDVSVSRERARSFNTTLVDEAKVPADDLLERRVGDYVQITDELLTPYDPYWSLDGNDCWEAIDSTVPAGLVGAQRGMARHDVCERTFGGAGEALTTRDFPILEASESSLVLGRYQSTGTDNSVRERTVVGADASSRGLLSAAKCCFHNQIQFNVRAGGTWLAFGSASQYLHHISSGEGGRCVQSCESRERLMNSRAYSLPREVLDTYTPPRSSLLAMRNPMFSYFLVDGRNAEGRVRPERDVVWRFASRNQFAALALSLTTTEISANPRSMQYLAPLGQVVVLDGASQGLTLIDLRTMGFAAAPVY